MRRLAWVLVLLLAALGCSRTVPPPDLPKYGKVPAFSLINHDGKRVGSAELAGHPYVLDFMFTTCTDFCPVMTAQMKRVRELLGPSADVYTVSVTVDPDKDKPEVLSAYGKRLGLDPKWYYLTGEKRQIHAMLLGLHLATQRDIDSGNKKLHSTRFILVDGTGEVRSYYAHDDDAARDKLIQDALSLQGKAP